MLILSGLTVLSLLLPLGTPCAPRFANMTGPSSGSGAPGSGPVLAAQPDTYATVTVDTTVPWSENGEDQQAASLPIDTQLRNLQSIYMHGEPRVQSITESPSGNGTRIVSQIGWNGNENQLRDALEEAFKYNELMAKFDVAMSPEK